MNLNPYERGGIPARGPVVGFAGTARYETVGDGDHKIFYVDGTHANASDSNDGTDPEAPMATLQALVDRTEATNAGTGTQRPIIGNYDTIFVGEIDESVEILDYTLIGSYCNLIGMGASMYNPAWNPATDADPCLVIGAIGWRISGFKFAPGDAAAGIVIPRVQAPYGANALGIRTIVENCYFDGDRNTGLYGIDLHGAPYDCVIQDCVFGFFNNGGNTATGIVSTNTGTADAYRTIIQRNWFHENDNHVNASLNVSLVKDNVFNQFGAVAAILVLDLRGGSLGQNIVTGNAFGDGDYSQAGGFYPNAANPGGWAGNTSEDVAEAEVGDNGWTILPPA